MVGFWNSECAWVAASTAVQHISIVSSRITPWQENTWLCPPSKEPKETRVTKKKMVKHKSLKENAGLEKSTQTERKELGSYSLSLSYHAHTHTCTHTCTWVLLSHMAHFKALPTHTEPRASINPSLTFKHYRGCYEPCLLCLHSLRQ